MSNKKEGHIDPLVFLFFGFLIFVCFLCYTRARTYLRDVPFLALGVDELGPTHRTRGRVVGRAEVPHHTHSVESMTTRKNHLVLVFLKLLHTDGTRSLIAVTSLELVKLDHGCFTCFYLA